VPDYRYKAYLSYSHEDARWATWLHRALEGYRVPSRLRADVEGELPERLAPIFRDRDDLSSASDLSKKLGGALDDSENLIVICSPAAARSRWVNQEIREFQALGRGDRIHCMVVDGDPQAAPEDGGCFPPALFEGVGEGGSEPLAADPRDFGDGKRLALQKLIAGLLGVRLDALRRRDLARQRRWRMVMAAASIGAIALLGYAITTGIAERQERGRAEQMAAFIVDLGDDLQDELDLESLARISTTAMGYLEQLDPDRLSPETRLKVGLALRQVGEVNLFQGKIEDARAAYERSHDVFLGLFEEYPGRDDVIFELSQSEFYIAEFHRLRGDYDRTRMHLQRYYEIARAQHEAMPEDPTWLLEYSYASSNLTNFRISISEPVDEAMLAELDRNIALAGQALEAWDGSTDVMGHYANELAWAADAQLGSCNLELARQTRIAALAVAEQLLSRDPGNRGLELDVAYRNAGLAGVLASLGDVPGARDHYAAGIELLGSLLARDPSSQKYREDLANHERAMARVLRHGNDLPAAATHLEDAVALFARISFGDETTEWYREVYLRTLEEQVRLALAQQDLVAAADALERLRETMKTFAGLEQGQRPGFDRLVNFRYLTWRLEQRDPATLDASLAGEVPAGNSPYRGCDEAEALARHAFLVGDQAQLETQLTYLEQAGYRDGDFLGFCRDIGRCPELRGGLGATGRGAGVFHRRVR
jgi:tetratricopeptide (TPR) repeat protein